MEQMRWLELLSAVRLGSKKSSTELARSPFHKDYDVLSGYEYHRVVLKGELESYGLTDGNFEKI
jgi:dGTPase